VISTDISSQSHARQCNSIAWAVAVVSFARLQDAVTSVIHVGIAKYVVVAEHQDATISRGPSPISMTPKRTCAGCVILDRHQKTWPLRERLCFAHRNPQPPLARPMANAPSVAAHNYRRCSVFDFVDWYRPTPLNFFAPTYLDAR